MLVITQKDDDGEELQCEVLIVMTNTVTFIR